MKSSRVDWFQMCSRVAQVQLTLCVLFWFISGTFSQLGGPQHFQAYIFLMITSPMQKKPLFLVNFISCTKMELCSPSLNQYSDHAVACGGEKGW